MFMQRCLTVAFSEVWRASEMEPATMSLPCVSERGCGRVHSPLSSHGSDWKELSECASDRLSRALHGRDGFSSSGFLERQGSRSTTLAERRWRTKQLHVTKAGDSLFFPAVSWQEASVIRGLPGIYSIKVHWKKKKKRNISKTEPNTKCKTYKYSLQTHRREILNKPACDGDYQTTWGIKILFEKW